MRAEPARRFPAQWRAGPDRGPRRPAAPAGKSRNRVAGSRVADGVAGNIDRAQRGKIRLELGVNLKDDAVLVRLPIDGRNLPLAEGVVKRIVQRLHGDAEPARDNAVGVDHHRIAVLLNVGGDVDQPPVVLQLGFEFLGPGREAVAVEPTRPYWYCVLLRLSRSGYPARFGMSC